MATIYKCPSCDRDVTIAVKKAFAEKRMSIKMVTVHDPVKFDYDEVEVQCTRCGTVAGYERELFGDQGS